ncbi:Uncharacterised protein [Serratia fonticola]|uniref:Major facilitator superfamily (MFS) profile domain-containing protein n=1 Tax=Serratia fonticola TaxID=47917 RepID=A0A4U9VT45_SERFO|nr:Uncharacterised protein [Serratia fonticola]
MLMARLLAGVGTGALTGAANIALVRFWPCGRRKQAALIAYSVLYCRVGIGADF